MVPLFTLNIDTPNLLICKFQQNPYMRKINDSQSVSSPRYLQNGLDLDLSGAKSSTVRILPFSWSLTLILIEEYLHLKLSRLILVKVINSL